LFFDRHLNGFPIESWGDACNMLFQRQDVVSGEHAWYLVHVFGTSRLTKVRLERIVNIGAEEQLEEPTVATSKCPRSQRGESGAGNLSLLDLEDVSAEFQPSAKGRIRWIVSTIPAVEAIVNDPETTWAE
jgi:hypothetical protein